MLSTCNYLPPYPTPSQSFPFALHLGVYYTNRHDSKLNSIRSKLEFAGFRKNENDRHQNQKP